MFKNFVPVSAKSNITLPLPPEASSLDGGDKDLEMEVYARFMRHLREVPNNRPEIKILAAVQFTANMSDHSDAHVSKILVELGLRAPRMAFPAEFLDYVDAALMRPDWSVGGASLAVQDLKEHWDRIGEDKFAAFRKAYPLLEECLRV